MNQWLGGMALATLLFGLLGPAGGGLERTELVFAPTLDTALEKRFDFGLRLTCGRYMLDGAAFVAQIEPVRLENSVKPVDRYASVACGAPRDFTRQFEQLSGRWSYGDSATELEGFHVLNGASVRFEWDEDLGEYARSWVAQPPRCALECPAENMGFRGPLPAGAVSVGERWTARGSALIDALWTSTELGLCAAPRTSIYDRLVQEVLAPPLRSAAAETLRIECAYKGAAPVQDDGVHRIALRVDQTTERDPAELANQFLGAGDWAALSGCVEQLSARWKLTRDGALDWDVAGGHFARFELALDVALDVRCVLPPGQERYVFDMRRAGPADWLASAAMRAPK